MKKLEKVVKKLRKVDGETMQNILKEVGAEEQMLNQLVMSMPINDVEHIFKERMELEAKIVLYQKFENLKERVEFWGLSQIGDEVGEAFKEFEEEINKLR
jgi:tetrahydromethanopterin S-methyltransferase subunit G